MRFGTFEGSGDPWGTGYLLVGAQPFMEEVSMKESQIPTLGMSGQGSTEVPYTSLSES